MTIYCDDTKCEYNEDELYCGKAKRIQIDENGMCTDCVYIERKEDLEE